MAKEENNKMWERIADLEERIKGIPEHVGGILSSVDLRERLVPADKVEEYLRFFKKRDWSAIEELETGGVKDYSKRYVISEYNELNLTPFSYDLSIGDEIFSIQKPDQRVFPLDATVGYDFEPGETIVVLTREVIAIPPRYSATVWPRFNMVRSGIFQSMVKIDPTWYGKLAVAMSNLSPATIKLTSGKAFATLLLYELSQPSDVDLWKYEDLQGVEVDVNVPKEFTDSVDRLDDFLFDKGDLRRFCRLEGEKLKVNGIKRRHIEELMKFDKTERWRAFVNTVAEEWAKAKHPKTRKRMIVMQALGMESLWDIVKDGGHGTRIEAGDILGQTCSLDELVDVARLYGKPFDVLAKIPHSLITRIESETAPKVQAQIEGSIFPKVITLVFSVLGFLSLIVAVLALTTKFWSADFFESAIMSTSFCVVVWALALLTSIALLCLVFKRWALKGRATMVEERALRKYFGDMKKQIGSLKNDLETLSGEYRSLRKEIDKKTQEPHGRGTSELGRKMREEKV